MYDWRHPVNQEMVEWLRAWGRSLHMEVEWLEGHGKQVYQTPVHNVMVSHAIVNQLTPILPKDDGGAMGKVKNFYAQLEAAMLMDPAFIKEAGKCG
jgi:hypothetical protein